MLAVGTAFVVMMRRVVGWNWIGSSANLVVGSPLPMLTVVDPLMVMMPVYFISRPLPVLAVPVALVVVVTVDVVRGPKIVLAIRPTHMVVMKASERPKFTRHVTLKIARFAKAIKCDEV